MPIDELTAQTLNEANSAAATFGRTLPPGMREHYRPVEEALQRIRATATQTADAIDAIDSPPADQPALNDPVQARRDVLEEADRRISEASRTVDASIERLASSLRERALPPEPRGIDASVARDTIRTVLGDATGAAAMRRFQRLAATGDKDVAATLLSEWGQALAESVGVDPSTVEGPILQSAAAGAFGETRKSYAAQLAKWGQLIEARSAAGVSRTFLARLARRGGS